MHGSGLHLAETLRLRVKDLDLGQGTITIHDGKGGRHRIVPLPKALCHHDLPSRHETSRSRRTQSAGPRLTGLACSAHRPKPHHILQRLIHFCLAGSPWEK